MKKDLKRENKINEKKCEINPDDFIKVFGVKWKDISGRFILILQLLLLYADGNNTKKFDLLNVGKLRIKKRGVKEVIELILNDDIKKIIDGNKIDYITYKKLFLGGE